MLSRHALSCGVLAGLGAACVLWLGPPGSDLAAHMYQRSVFVHHGFQLWDNYWYAGRYSFAGYSWLYYPLAAVLGIKLLSVLTAAVAAAAFAALVAREWPTVGNWPGVVFAFVAALSTITGAYPYALGFACALLALVALRPFRPVRFTVCAALAFAASPLAFALLLVILLALAAGRRARSATFAVVGVAIGAAVLWRLFPNNGRFPFSVPEFAATLTFCSLGALLTVRVPAAHVIRRFFFIYGVAAVVAFLVPSSIGENIARLRFVALPVIVLVLSLRRWRPLVPAWIALLLAASWNVTPLASAFAHGSVDPSAHSSYWLPVVRYLSPRLRPSFRVEAVDTTGHWEAFFLPEHKIPIVRGWFRQSDFPDNAVLYGDVTASSYRAWLRSMGVEYVVLTDAPPDYSAKEEARLLRGGRSGLRRVFSTPHSTIYRVPHPVGIVSGAPNAQVTTLARTAFTLALPHAGSYRVAVHYSPYWRASAGCLTERKDTMMNLKVDRAGPVQLSFSVTSRRAVDAGLGREAAC